MPVKPAEQALYLTRACAHIYYPGRLRTNVSTYYRTDIFTSAAVYFDKLAKFFTVDAVHAIYCSDGKIFIPFVGKEALGYVF